MCGAVQGEGLVIYPGDEEKGDIGRVGIVHVPYGNKGSSRRVQLPQWGRFAPSAICVAGKPLPQCDGDQDVWWRGAGAETR